MLNPTTHSASTTAYMAALDVGRVVGALAVLGPRVAADTLAPPDAHACPQSIRGSVEIRIFRLWWRAHRS